MLAFKGIIFQSLRGLREVCVLIAVNNWVIGLTGKWYSISVIFLTIGIFNLEQAVQYFGPYYSAI